MLEANPDLGWRDVHNILAMSAAHTGSALGGPGTGFEVAAWEVNGAATWNGGGSGFHGSYGYGMVDAFAATRMAEAWATLYAQAATSANTVQIDAFQDFAPVALSDFAAETGPGVTLATVQVRDDLDIETV
jgi:hypothetical protein